MRVAGIEMGGTKCVLLLAEGPDRVIARERIPTAGPEETLAAIEGVLDRWAADPGFDAVGIASFGPLSLDPAAPDYGSITATTKPGWQGTDLHRRLSRRYGRPTGIETDVSGAALAEGRWGGAQGMADHLYITIGTGVGVGTIVGGRPLLGYSHGEAGHMRVARAPGDDWGGHCPFHGDCVEGLIAGPALAARFGTAGEALATDDPRWGLFVHDLAGLLHNLVLAFAPQRIAVGGGVIADRDALFGPLRRALTDSLGNYGSIDRWTREIDRRVGPPALGSMAGPLGAIAVGLHAAER